MTEQVETEVVEWITHSGTRHKFGPMTQSRYSGRGHRRSLCAGHHYSDEKIQKNRRERKLCRRCFPDGDQKLVNELTAKIRHANGSFDGPLDDEALAKALISAGVRP